MRPVEPLQAGCPWSSWARPNNKWCEENLCSWVTAPANTWSNLAYILAGAAMLRRAPRERRATLFLFGPACIATGVCSLLFHASYTWFFQWFDFLGMYLFAWLPIVLNLRRMRLLRGRGDTARAYGAGVGACCALTVAFYYARLPFQLIVLVLVLVGIAQEYCLWLADRRPDLTMFVASMALLTVAFAFSVLDALDIWCDPRNHYLQGHAVWHLLSAAALFFTFRHFEQFSFDGEEGLPLLPAKEGMELRGSRVERTPAGQSVS